VSYLPATTESTPNPPPLQNNQQLKLPTYNNLQTATSGALKRGIE